MVSYHVFSESVERDLANPPGNEPTSGAASTDAVSAPPVGLKLRRALPGGILSVFLVVSGCGAFFSLFSQFHFYDDEGYLLISLRQFLQGLPLYDEVFSQYGPFHYLAHGLLFKAGGLTANHDSMRLIMLAEAVGIALLAAGVFLRLTGNRWLSTLVFPVALQAVQPLFWEPGHPQSLTLLLLFGLALTAVAPIDARRMGVMGAGVGCLLMTKINVGIFALLALVWTAAIFADPRWRRAPAIAAGVAILALPWVLMWAQLGQIVETVEFALTISISFLAVALTCLAGDVPEPRLGLRPWLAGAAGCLGAVALLGTATLLTGTSVNGLLHGVAWRPGKSLFILTSGFDAGSVGWGALSLACALLVRGRPLKPGSFSFGTILALKGSLGFLAAMEHGSGLFDRALPFVWLGLIPPPGDAQGNRPSFGRVFVISLTVVHALVAYPVAGTQKAVAWVPLVLVGAICLHDAWRMWNAMRTLEGTRLRGATAFGLLSLALLVHQGYSAGRAFQRYRDREALDLPGARLLRLPSAEGERLRQIVRELGPYDTFVTVPGMNSLYLLAQKEPPTGLNCTAWMLLLSDAEQKRIARAVAAVPRCCVVYDRHMLEFWGAGPEFDDAPLLQFLKKEYHFVKTVGGFEVHERLGH